MSSRYTSRYTVTKHNTNKAKTHIKIKNNKKRSFILKMTAQALIIGKR